MSAASSSLSPCAICLDALHHDENLNVKLHPDQKIQHVFHKNCLDEWLKTKGSCPVCRKSIKKIKPLEIETVNISSQMTIILVNFSFPPLSHESIFSLLDDQTTVLRTIIHRS